MEIWFKQRTRSRMNYEWIGEIILKNLNQKTKTYPAYCRKIAAVDSHNSIGIDRKKIMKKIDFRTKLILSAIYFDVILYLNKLLSLSKRLQGLVSIPISIIDSKYNLWEQCSSIGHLKMGLSRFYFWLWFFYTDSLHFELLCWEAAV